MRNFDTPCQLRMIHVCNVEIQLLNGYVAWNKYMCPCSKKSIVKHCVDIPFTESLAGGAIRTHGEPLQALLVLCRPVERKESIRSTLFKRLRACIDVYMKVCILGVRTCTSDMFATGRRLNREKISFI